MPTPAAVEAGIHTIMEARVEAVHAGPYVVRDLVVVPGYEAAFCHGLHHVAGTLTTGQKVDMWWRATQGFRRIDDKWQIVHEHSFLPFDMASGKVSFELKP